MILLHPEDPAAQAFVRYQAAQDEGNRLAAVAAVREMRSRQHELERFGASKKSTKAGKLSLRRAATIDKMIACLMEKEDAQ